jgi:hypothetical protein
MTQALYTVILMTAGSLAIAYLIEVLEKWMDSV